MQRNYKGYFISLEGPEGCGKTSQIPKIVEHLRGLGLTVFPTREPGGTSISEQIRDVLHDLKNFKMHPRTETLLYQAARAQIVEEVILPRLRDGEVVISDRYFDSTIAYQGFGREQNIQSIMSLVEFATGGLKPDLTLYMSLDVEVGLERKRKNNDEWNRMDDQEIQFYQRVKEGYSWIMSHDSGRFSLIDAVKSPDEVYEQLRTSIESRLRFNGFLEGGRRGIER